MLMKSEHRKELVSEIRSLAQSQGLNTVFTTFLEITANSLAAQTDPENAEKREQRYQEMASTMTPELLSSYARMLALLFLTVREYRDDPCDILGGIYHELNLKNNLEKHGAMEYTIVLASMASDSSSLQYIAPYAGTALAEYFMYKGQDALIVYDDLSKHAVAYRAISLLLERSPGREAYPGDVFYLHSRLLERASRLSEKLGGGSLTALPIIETQAGDLSAYIPTNVISITDGQIFLESHLFFSGMRPAVSVGLSVSRVGGAAQTSAMKKASGSIRIDLAQYREMEVFTQFASDLDDITKQQLKHGHALLELLKQPLGKPLQLNQQVITLHLANKGYFDDVELKSVKKFQNDLLAWFDLQHADICEAIQTGGQLTDELKKQIDEAAEAFKQQ